MESEREFELRCARRLVELLFERHQAEFPGLLGAYEVKVGNNWKTEFKFGFVRRADSLSRRRDWPNRFGSRPGLEMHWDHLTGDVDAWQIDGSLKGLLMHGWQIVSKWLTREEERPSKLLAAMGVRTVRNEMA